MVKPNLSRHKRKKDCHFWALFGQFLEWTFNLSFNCLQPDSPLLKKKLSKINLGLVAPNGDYPVIWTRKRIINLYVCTTAISANIQVNGNAKYQHSHIAALFIILKIIFRINIECIHLISLPYLSYPLSSSSNNRPCQL